jgi:AraC family transcriptional regulator
MPSKRALNALQGKRIVIGEEEAFAAPSSETQAPAVIWTPDDFAAHSRDKPIVSSRETTDWERIVVERWRQPPQELDMPASTHPVLALTLGPPFRCWRKIGNDIQEGLLVSGSIVLIAAGQPRLARWDATAEYLRISLHPELLKRAAQALLVDPDRMELTNAFAVADPKIEYICKALLAELEQGAPGGRLFAETLAAALALHLLRTYAVFPAALPSLPDKLSRSELRRALEYIHDNLGDDLSLREIAGAACVSTNYFAGLFKKEIGVSPHQYVIQQRVERAKALLREGKISVAEIAVQVGFYDATHLTRHFKRLTGTTPRAFTKNRKP